eukprot:CAMPEP_0169462700 /NCGR_PEP_ID=MMETSP1042-20121227/19705_1 /TAXON_ID=464988 /ORGANISM="Hemiselmis andersenii, Strain CCMP1180" /LENGTH=70 /DNA_ID=CAMNT_0009575365 /DNA_START=56 /DNA_END=264 /DNA_ORIENTATION=+
MTHRAATTTHSTRNTALYRAQRRKWASFERKWRAILATSSMGINTPTTKRVRASVPGLTHASLAALTALA